METSPNVPWYERYPRMSTDAELFIESERTRMYQEVSGSAAVSDDATEQQLAFLEELRGKNPHDIDHGDFCRFMFYEMHAHYSALEDKQRARYRGEFDETFAERCRIYEALLTNGDDTAQWIKQIPGHDINKLPEPVIVNMLMSGFVERFIGTKPKALARISSRYRQAG